MLGTLPSFFSPVKSPVVRNFLGVVGGVSPAF